MTESVTSAPQASNDLVEERLQVKRALAWTHTARFRTTASRLSEVPVSELPEIAFVGRSNAGKSTAINMLAQQRRLAFSSKTPGRTQHINLFDVGPKDAPDATFVDLPGYGYAAVERNAKLRWQIVMADYLAIRRNLAGIVLLVDSRHGFTDLDQRFLEFVATRLANGSVSLLTLLTKSDKLGKRQIASALEAGSRVLETVTTDVSDIGLAAFSSFDPEAIGSVASTIHDWIGRHRAPGSAPDGGHVADAERTPA
jgi:GTP-binding protein